MIALGRALGFGTGVPADFDGGVKWLTTALDKAGDSTQWAWFGLGDLYASAEAGHRDPDKAVAAYGKAVALGNPFAMIALARMYGFADGVPADFAKARDLLERAIAAGRPGDAGKVLGDLYLTSIGGKDAKEALAMYELSAQAGNGAAHLAAAMLQSVYYETPETRVAMAGHFREAAGSLGPDAVARAMFNLSPNALYAAVQELLKDAGYSPGILNGTFDRRTQAAIDNFCAAKKIAGCGRAIIAAELLKGLLVATPSTKS
jgi:TPR repeat protein